MQQKPLGRVLEQRVGHHVHQERVDLVVVAQERHVIAPLPSLLGGQHETPKLRAAWIAAMPALFVFLWSTGFLGVHLLRELLTATSAQVHCLVRAHDTAHFMGSFGLAGLQWMVGPTARLAMVDLSTGRFAGQVAP